MLLSGAITDVSQAQGEVGRGGWEDGEVECGRGLRGAGGEGPGIESQPCSFRLGTLGKSCHFSEPLFPHL